MNTTIGVLAMRHAKPLTDVTSPAAPRAADRDVKLRRSRLAHVFNPWYADVSADIYRR